MTFVGAATTVAAHTVKISAENVTGHDVYFADFDTKFPSSVTESEFCDINELKAIVSLLASTHWQQTNFTLRRRYTHTHKEKIKTSFYTKSLQL